MSFVYFYFWASYDAHILLLRVSALHFMGRSRRDYLVMPLIRVLKLGLAGQQTQVQPVHSAGLSLMSIKYPTTLLLV